MVPFQVLKFMKMNMCYAFMDIAPLTKGHTLLIPKEHVKDLFEMPEEVARNLYAVAPKIANAIKIRI